MVGIDKSVPLDRLCEVGTGLALPFANVANCDGKIIFAKEI